MAMNWMVSSSAEARGAGGAAAAMNRMVSSGSAAAANWMVSSGAAAGGAGASMNAAAAMNWLVLSGVAAGGAGGPAAAVPGWSSASGGYARARRAVTVPAR
ncbi:MAG TPA: hypothetical protein VIY52_12155 [Streptosporangiaceae bacterium]